MLVALEGAPDRENIFNKDETKKTILENNLDSLQSLSLDENFIFKDIAKILNIENEEFLNLASKNVEFKTNEPKPEIKEESLQPDLFDSASDDEGAEEVLQEVNEKISNANKEQIEQNILEAIQKESKL